MSAAVELFVPGRLCLFGEHSDWAGGYRTTAPALVAGRCLVTGTDQGLRARATAADGVVEIASVLPDGTRRGPVHWPARVEALAAAARDGGFFSYAAGVAAEVLAHHAVGGLRLEIGAADLPTGKGLSSSAALCVLVARAFSQVHGLGLEPRAEMQVAWAGERRAGSACGLMDQVCAFGRRTVLMTFDGADLAIEPVGVGAAIHLVIVDLMRAKDTRRILADLNACFPDAADPTSAAVREALGPRNATLVAAARRTIEQGDTAALGALMTEAQHVFDALIAPACPELAAPRLHEVLAHPAVAEMGWGGKGVGSQGDGCAQLVARGPDERDALARRLGDDLGVSCLPLTLDATS